MKIKRLLKMIMPSMGIPLRETLLYSGMLILSELKEPDTVSSLREKTQSMEELSSYEKFILTLDFLYIIGAVNLRDGLIIRSANAKV